MEEKKKKCCILCLIKKCIIFFVPGFIAALIIFVIINASLVPTSKPKFCGTLCHEMDEAYTSWQEGPHAKNRTGVVTKCIDCHLPPKDKYFTHLAAKAQTGIKDAYKHFFGGEYNAEEIRESVREHMTNDVCLRCHKDLQDSQANEAAMEMHDMMIFNPGEGEEPAKCIECHDEVGHVR
jgi:cytochrome c nitrite reductase small subunit